MKKPNDSVKNRLGELQGDSRTRLRVLGSKSQAAGLSGSEFPAGADELVISGAASRRKFMGILGASTALAGLSSGCIRKPAENIMPYSKRPEDIIPGNALFYATALAFGSSVQGVVVETHEGRPTKVEGNPGHPSNKGRTDVYAQAAILSLYDPDRSRNPWSRVHQVHLVVKGKATEQEAKDLVTNQLCTQLYDQTLAATKSSDRARTLREACRAAAKTEAASFEFEPPFKKSGKAPKERVVTISLSNEVQSETSWELAWHKLDSMFAKLGPKTAVVVRESMSPSYKAGIRQLAQTKRVHVFIDDPTADANGAAGAEMIAGPGARVRHSLVGAKVIASFDCDFLGVEGDHVRLAGEWAAGRQARTPEEAKSMSRLYSLEPHLTGTGAMADERLGLRAADIGRALAYVAVKVHDQVGSGGAKMVGTADDIQAVKKAANALNPGADFWGPQGITMLDALAADLVSAKSKGSVLVGPRQPATVHALAHYINAMLGSLGGDGLSVMLVSQEGYGTIAGGPAELANVLADGNKLDTVICIGTNPAYDTAGSLGLAEKLSKVETLVHVGTHRDETGQIAAWHLPLSHELESWGDLETADGIASIVQPMLDPLHSSVSALEFVARLIRPAKAEKGLDIVKSFYKASDKKWRQWLHSGVVASAPSRGVASCDKWAALAQALPKLPKPGKGMEINFHLCPKVLDGAFSNNAWMQELPAPISKLVWDNAAAINLKDAKDMALENGDRLAINIDGRTAAIPVWISPGQARGSISLTLGYGRRDLGEVSAGAGFDTYKLQDSENPWFGYGQADRGAGNYDLVSTQDWGYLDPDGPNATALRAQLGDLDYPERTLYRSESVAGFERDPDFSQKGDFMPPERLHSLWEHPELTGKQQWGMSIDLNNCTGCNTCVIACQAENNIAIVGKKECGNGREMHWIRMDRYYRDFGDQPKTDIMPVACMHCETAPCENVCPVQATAHSPEGLNDMAYNRCIGTRYCANNCPYKVRRFNFFNFNLDLDPLTQMSKNPDVTVRFRGVIEKCSYCVQRIQQNKIEAHVEGKDTIEDGALQVACEQACPTGAIVFGDVADESTRVSQAKKQTRDYGLLTDLLTMPRTTYLARVRNPNPKLGKAEG